MSDYRPFTSRCPTEDCVNNKFIDWIHDGCGARYEINSKAETRCSIHTENGGNILNIRFNCREHGSENRPVDADTLFFTLSPMIMGCLSNEDKAWANKLKEYLNKMYRDALQKD